MTVPTGGPPPDGSLRKPPREALEGRWESAPPRFVPPDYGPTFWLSVVRSVTTQATEHVQSPHVECQVCSAVVPVAGMGRHDAFHEKLFRSACRG